MGRRERELDPSSGPVARFAHELRKLRDAAGPLTYRAMAVEARYSTATLAEAAAGEHLPSLPVALAYVRACGGDVADWEQRWHAAEQEAAGERLAAGGMDVTEAPYRGLARFETGDTALFFGRDRTTGHLAELVRARPCTALSGPSGSGKSSLIRAGLVPLLRHLPESDGRPSVIRILTPGPHPAGTHAALLAPAATSPRSLLIIDQFEELFTLCADPVERTRFIKALLDTTRADLGGRVLIAVRADFLGHLAQDRRLADAAGAGTFLLGPMSREELRDAITRPAAAQGLLVERSLTARIVEELDHQPGGLPLMSHALLETWRRRRGRTLTESAYHETGGLAGAIAHTAEECYERLSPAQRRTARHLLLRLVTPGQGAQDTRRPVPRAELGLPADEHAGRERAGEAERADQPEESHGAGDLAVVVERLVRARLITLDHDTVDLAHEALLTAWPRLRGWIDEDRERIRCHRHLTEAAVGWHALGRDPGALYRGLRLTTAREYFPERPDPSGELTALEARFLAASNRAALRAQRRSRVGVGALSVLLALAVLVGLVAWQQNRISERRRVEHEARRIAGTAESLRQSDPVTSMRLSLAAWNVADLPETRATLLSAMTQPQQNLFTDPDTSGDTMRRLSDDGRTLLSIGSKSVVEWDVRTGRQRRVMPGLGASLNHTAPMRSDGPRVLDFGEDTSSPRRVGLRDLATGRTGRPLSTELGGGANLGPSGRLLVTYETAPPAPGTPRRMRTVLRDTATGAVRLSLPPLPWRESRNGDGFVPATSSALERQHTDEKRDVLLVQDVVISRDDALLAWCLPGEPLQLWDVARRRRLDAPWAPTMSRDACVNEAAQFTHDSRALVLADGDGIRSWELATGKERRLVTHPKPTEVRFSPDGRFVAATDRKELLIWRIGPETQRRPVYRFPLAGEDAGQLRFDLAAGRLSYMVGAPSSLHWGSAVRTLDIRRILAPEWRPAPATGARFSADGTLLVVARQQGNRMSFRLRDLRPAGGWTELPSMPCGPPGNPYTLCEPLLAFRPDSRVLVYGIQSGDIEQPTPPHMAFWDVNRRRVTDTQDLVVPEGRIPGLPELGAVSYTSDGRFLLLTQPPTLGSTHLWDPRRRAVVRSWPGVQGNALGVAPDGSMFVTSDGAVRDLRRDGRPAVERRVRSSGIALTFSPNGALLATGDETGRVMLWDGQACELIGEVKPADLSYPPPVVTSLAFSPDSRLLAVEAGGTIQIWDVDSRMPLGLPMPTAGDFVTALGFSADGSTLRVSGEHVDLAAYRIDPRTAATTVCRRANGPLSKAAWKTFLPDIPFTRSCPIT
ncbi:WD-40 repeat protein [Streptomyces laurentii]|uniref:WD-40 repeat protein n=1 Tax=Streptomyces laurentii TaxID=39478 RepID=A0A160P8C6_STRLU|nr:WD-40 repeat protein [Streptomyces laurentii]